MRSLIALTAALLLATAAPAMAQTVQNGTITIDGTGEISAAPDTAFINSGVTSQGITAREALDANTAAMAELIATLKAAGIEDRDIQTSGFSVQPNYVYSDARDANGYTMPPKIVGYQVTNSVMVKVRKLDTLGSVLDKSVTVGANTVNGVNFTVEDPRPLLDEARKLAFEDARAKAELYAGLAGVELDDLISISESQGGGGPQPFMARYDMVAASAPVPVQAGEVSYSISVQISWRLDDAN